VKQRHIPQRSCVACRTVRDKKELVRLVRTPEGEVHLDPTGKQSGRGAYLCPRLDCLRVAQKRKSLDRAFKATVPTEAWARLEEQLAASDEQ
jgi:predicted RNA-binding protein YlxR (DUF448 family)